MISGATAERPQLKKLMANLTAGDVVVIPAVDRLSRDTTDLLVIVRDMQRAGAGLRSLADPVVDTTSDFAELVLAMLGVAAKLERRRIIARTARGRADAKGVKSDASLSSPRISSARRASGSTPARHSAASPAVTTSVRRRSRDSQCVHTTKFPTRNAETASLVRTPNMPGISSWISKVVAWVKKKPSLRSYWDHYTHCWAARGALWGFKFCHPGIRSSIVLDVFRYILLL
jgi:hypothetical protein